MRGQYTFSILVDHPPGKFTIVGRRVRGIPSLLSIYSCCEEQTHSSMLSKSSMVYIAICFPSSFLHHRPHLSLSQSHLCGCHQYRNHHYSTLPTRPLQCRNQLQSLGPHTMRTRFA